MTFITGFTDLEPRKAYNLAVEAILPKPIERVQLVDLVRRALPLARRNLERARDSLGVVLGRNNW